MFITLSVPLARSPWLSALRGVCERQLVLVDVNVTTQDSYLVLGGGQDPSTKSFRLAVTYLQVISRT